MKTLPRFVVLTLSLVVGVLACRPSKTPQEEDNLVIGKLSDGGVIEVQAAAPAPAPQSEDEAAVPIFANDATRGSRLAAVTIVVFSDFQCPFCSRLVPTLDRLYETYGAENLRIVFKNQPLPFHPHAQLAAEVGQGVLELSGNEAFWRYHDLVFEKQRDMEPEPILAWAAAAGADERLIRDGIQQRRWATKVSRDREAARTVGANGTPASFVNGILVSGAQSFEKFKAVVEAELEVSRGLASQGIPREQIYTRLAATNFKSKEDEAAAEERAEAAREAAELKVVHKIPAGNGPARGPATAEVTIIEFSDFQCPYCKKVGPTLERIRREYGDKVRIVWRDNPLSFHPRAEPAAQLARAARAQKGDAGFWAVHDALFASQPKLDDADLEQIATDAKLDVQKAMAAVKAKTYASAIDADVVLGDDFEVKGTPNFFVNGRRLSGAQPFEKFKPLIDEEIAKATALLKAGTARTALYDALIKDGKTPPEPERRAVPGLSLNAPFRGAANAKVVIQEFADFQCPFCAKVDATLEDLLKAYPGKVKIVWRDLPLSIHADAPLAAEAAREAFKQKGNDGFAKMQALLFKNQSALSRSDLDGYAQQIGLDATKFAVALDNHTHAAAVQAEKKAAEDAKVTGTPGFLVGPYWVSGAQPLSKFKKVVALAMNPPPAPPPPPVAPAPGPERTTPTGLKIKDVAIGTGREVKSGDTVRVHYVGTLTDGSVFDASKKRGDDGFTFQVGQGRVIKGWDEGLVGMKVGGKRKLTIPPDLAYGDRGAGATIPPKSTLVFEVDLLEVR
ncbi:MAG: thioredoxin domain-containing protein [Labilithrix sp.]|nr:thioredoxin domain-containing protein [Labilithrix sp.]MCW5810952.1 thioredoxin domain-containing protein [Labilithrix sp.]